MKYIPLCIIAHLSLILPITSAAEPAVRQVIPAKTAKTDVPPDVMQRINDETKAPFKYGVVIKGAGGNRVDCPSVFRKGDLWYMTYIEYDGSGYISHIASSPDLLAWKPLGVILKRSENGWDAQQAAGYISLQDYQWGGSYAYQPFDGKYWLTYIGGALKGYDTDPLSIGLVGSNTDRVGLKPRQFSRERAQRAQRTIPVFLCDLCVLSRLKGSRYGC